MGIGLNTSSIQFKNIRQIQILLNLSQFFDIHDFDKQEKNEEISFIPKILYSNQIFNLLNGLLLTWINQSEKYIVYDYC